MAAAAPPPPAEIRDDDVEMAIKICTTKEFKECVLKVFGEGVNNKFRLKSEWNTIVERCLERYFAVNHVEWNIQEKVTGIVFSIAFRMLVWLEFHMGVFLFTEDVGISLLVDGIFNENGIIRYDETKKLVTGQLGELVRYWFASWHSMQQECRNLFPLLGRSRNMVYNPEDDELVLEPEIVKFWGYYINGDINRIKDKKAKVDYPGNQTVTAEEVKSGLKPFKKLKTKTDNEYMLECAISSGSLTSVQFSINKLIDKKKSTKIPFPKMDVLVDALLEVVIYKIKLKTKIEEDYVSAKNKKDESKMDVEEKDESKMDVEEKKVNRKFVDDWIVFRSPKFSPRVEGGDIWTPSHFLVDIFFSIFSAMSADEKSKIAPKLKEAILFEFNTKTSYKRQLFCHFLCWPYQKQLMEFVNLCWRCVPNECYGSFLFSIFHRINPKPESLFYGENKTYDYNELFKEFWCNSPEYFKRYVFEDVAETKKLYTYDNLKIYGSLGKTLLLNMIDHTSFFINNTMVKVVLDSATIEERTFFLNSEEGKEFFDRIWRKRENSLCDEVLIKCVKSEEEFRKTKTKIELPERILRLVAEDQYLNENDRYPAVRNLFESLQLSPKEQFEIKEKMLRSDQGIRFCLRLGLENCARFVILFEWSELNVPHKIIPFIDSLLNSGRYSCLSTSIESPEKATQFLRVCYKLKGVEEALIGPSIELFKEHIAHREGLLFCKDLIFLLRLSEEQAASLRTKLNHVDNVINWCFAPEYKRARYRKELLAYDDGIIHYTFIKAGRIEDSSLFLSWVGLSEEEIKREKKNKFFNCTSTAKLFEKVMRFREVPALRPQSENYIRTILNWFLVDREAIREFRAKYYFYRNDPFINHIMNLLENSLQN